MKLLAQSLGDSEFVRGTVRASQLNRQEEIESGYESKHGITKITQETTRREHEAF